MEGGGPTSESGPQQRDKSRGLDAAERPVIPSMERGIKTGRTFLGCGGMGRGVSPLYCVSLVLRLRPHGGCVSFSCVSFVGVGPLY